MSKLEQIYAPYPDSQIHVIFIHGLSGHPRETWMRDIKDDKTLWPLWVGEDTGCSVWLLGYEAAISAWTEVAMALPLQGTNILDTILSEPKLPDDSINPQYV